MAVSFQNVCTLREHFCGGEDNIFLFVVLLQHRETCEAGVSPIKYGDSPFTSPSLQATHASRRFVSAQFPLLGSQSRNKRIIFCGLSLKPDVLRAALS